MDWLQIAFVLVIVALTLWQFWPARMPWQKDPAIAEAEKAEAYFKAMFPELQPWYHPLKLLEFVAALRARDSHGAPAEWANPPGLGVAAARFSDDNGRRRVELVDAAGAVLSTFFYEAQPYGSVMRIGKGKLTVDLGNPNNHSVRYWHPEREFKWARRHGWRFTTRLADQPFDSNDSGTRWSSDHGTTSSGAAAAAGAAGIVAAGGAFAGAGASDDWGRDGGSPGEWGAASAGAGDASIASADTSGGTSDGTSDGASDGGTAY